MIYIKRFLYNLLLKFKPPHNTRTIRYAFPFALVTIAFIAASVLTSASESYVKISTTNNEVKAGDLFTIDVLVGAEVPVNAVDVTVSFPADQIKILGIDTGESVITIWTTEPYVKNNTVILRGGTFRKGFLGEHLVAQINAKAIKSGSAKFSADSVTLLAGDGRGTTVSTEDTGSESLTMYVDVTKPLINTNNQIYDTSAPGQIKANVEVGIYTDIDGNGDVDFADIKTFMSSWGSKTAKFDFNNDGKMNFVDFAILLADSFYK